MQTLINAKTLRAELQSVIRRVQKGERFTVLYRSRPACEIVPVNGGAAPGGDLKDEPLYKAAALGRSQDRRTAADHDELLYGRSR
jgi:antitoxin (DNA-binding transcriptional repressor) of toxin-antitoxin stability system